MTFARDIEEDRAIRRGHIQIPIHPTETFPPTINAVYLVFSVHKHYTPYQVIGRLFFETHADTPSSQWIDEDIAYLATEDESGYLKFFPPDGTWIPGQYRVDIYGEHRKQDGRHAISRTSRHSTIHSTPP